MIKQALFRKNQNLNFINVNVLKTKNNNLFLKKIQLLKQYIKIKNQIQNQLQRQNQPETALTTIHNNRVIPLNLFQTWYTKKLPLRMLHNVLSLKNNNPEFNHYLFDDNDCEKFIEKHFDANVLHAFRSLKPGAYRADLWRYCVLYKLGGIYLDIKYNTINNFKLIYLTECENWVLDRGNTNIYNAMIVSKPGNPILWKAIQDIVENVKTRFYGGGFLDPTGPGLLAKYFTKEEKDQFVLKHDIVHNNLNHRYIFMKNVPIIKSYDCYLEDSKRGGKKYYGEYWHKREVYK